MAAAAAAVAITRAIADQSPSTSVVDWTALVATQRRRVGDLVGQRPLSLSRGVRIRPIRQRFLLPFDDDSRHELRSHLRNILF